MTKVVLDNDTLIAAKSRLMTALSALKAIEPTGDKTIEAAILESEQAARRAVIEVNKALGLF